MPLTSSVPDVGCCRSAIRRSIVVLPQPEGPMKETNSPSAISRLTFASASTLPSDVSNVSETLRTSTAKRCGVETDSTAAAASLLMCTGWFRAAKDSRPSPRSVTHGSFGFNDFGSCSVMDKYWQTSTQVARSMFAQRGNFNGKTTIGAKHAPIGFSDSEKTTGFFDLRRAPPHTLRGVSLLDGRRVLLSCMRAP